MSRNATTRAAERGALHHGFARLLAAMLGLVGMTLALGAHAQEPVRLNVYAIPSAAIEKAVTKASADLAARGMTSFQARGHAVHATLYLTQYPQGSEERLIAAIAALAREQTRIPLVISGAERTPSDWLFLTLERSAALQRLADLVTRAAEPLRDHAVEPPEWMEAYPDKLPVFERYGSPNVFAQFDPHLTLLARETSPELDTFMAQAKADPPHAEGMVEGIGIGRVDADGQIVETLAEFRFPR
ncbi:2'-5' RNA ligase family protein [Novosphingobium sp. MBES04]|uniref:2'-5' RNA ligase family protein n=1 Tax=Novosphingobium sp. MBES04 TaxID=1206458 RepID=UPI000723770C|nr:2'-5' RNA ligase family protein [Novosphingobium sp. MBES04]GAM03667.1 signal peptide [Novosphingobium sp. MBES04]